MRRRADPALGHRRPAPGMKHRRSQRESPKRPVAPGTALEMREQIAAALAVERTAPKAHEILTCLETVHYLLSALCGRTRRAAWRRNACRARKARILTFASLQPTIPAISLP